MSAQLDQFGDRLMARMRAGGLFAPCYAEIEEFLAMGYPPDEPVNYTEEYAACYNIQFSGTGVCYTGAMMEWITFPADAFVYSCTGPKIRLLWAAGARLRREWLRLPRIHDGRELKVSLPVLLQATALVAFRAPATLLQTGRWRRIPIELFRLLVGFLIPYVI